MGYLIRFQGENKKQIIMAQSDTSSLVKWVLEVSKLLIVVGPLTTRTYRFFYRIREGDGGRGLRKRRDCSRNAT